MKTGFRVEVNSYSKYFENKKEAFDYFISKIGCGKDVELWVIHYSYSEFTRNYIATQTLLDYYSVDKK